MTEDKFNEWIFSRRDRLSQGKLNTVPLSLKLLSYYYPGLDGDTYLNITAETKNGKTNFASFAFLLEPLWYAYFNRKLEIDYLYINAEEGENRIKSRIVCYLLYKYTNGEVRIGYKSLISSSKPLSKDVCNILESDDFIDIRDFFFNHIEFTDVSYPTGIEIEIKKFASKFGEIISGEPFTTIDNITGKTKTITPIVGYKHNNPDAFKIIFFDNFNNTTPERGQTLLQAMTSVSKGLKDNRNKLGFPIVSLQQQSADNDSTDAFKLKSVEPKITSLGDCRQVGRDLNNCIGIFIPAMKFKNLPDEDPMKRSYKGYDLTKFGTYFAVISILVNRDGESDVKIPVFFDGKCCIYEELPNPKDEKGLQVFYDRITRYKKEELQERKEIDEFKRKFNSQHNTSSALLAYSTNNINSIGNKNIFSIFAKFFNKIIKRK